jgi:uncharacterized protein with GYD domain
MIERVWFIPIKEVFMARYLVLINFTDQGVRQAKDTLKRAAAARQAFEKVGARVSQVLWTIGQYDGALLAEAPSDEVITAVCLQIGSLGFVRTTTLRAFDEKEMEQIIGKV